MLSRDCADAPWSLRFLHTHRVFGSEWVNRLILAQDKTHIAGDILVDDKPKITGTGQAAWRQVVFDRAYNRTTEAGDERHRLVNWEGQGWKRVLASAL